MKTKMLISIAIVLFCLFGTVTCRSLEDRTEEVGVTALLEQTEQLGVLHNQLLDSAIHAIMLERVRVFKESGGIEQMTRAGGDEVVGRYASVILNTLKRASRNLGVPVSDKTEEQYFSREKFIALSTRAASLDSELELTPFQQKYYDRLVEIISAQESSLDEVLYNIAELENQIAVEAPTAEEAQVLFYGTVTARHSYAYWQKNTNTWRTVLNGKIIAVGNIEDFEREMILAESATRAVDDPPYTQVPPGTFIPFPGDPRYFFRVEDEGRVLLFQCPQGLIFNPATCTCEISYFG
jgi:hypothetical protein